MKKAVSIAAVAILSATALCGCSKSTTSGTKIAPKSTEIPKTQSQSQPETNTDSSEKPEEIQKIEITINGKKIDEYYGSARRRSAISGVGRHYKLRRDGTYTVEYIHAPYGVDKDETLDYRLTLKDDNTYELTVVSNGVTAVHNGHWYERNHEITMFYDEQIEQQPHNFYVGDRLFANVLPKGKIMIYDDCYTIVLAKQTETDEPAQDNQSAQNNQTTTR